MDTKILLNYVKILEKYIEYANQYNNIKYDKDIFNNGFVLLSNIFLLLFKNNTNMDTVYNLLDKSYMYYIEFINNVDLLNIAHNIENSNIQIANIFCIKKIFTNLDNENNIENNCINDNDFYEQSYLIVNIITNIYIKIYCYFNSYTERYIFNNFIIDYISNIIKNNNNSDNKLESLLLNINNKNLNLEIKDVIYKYNNNYTVT